MENNGNEISTTEKIMENLACILKEENLIDSMEETRLLLLIRGGEHE